MDVVEPNRIRTRELMRSPGLRFPRNRDIYGEAEVTQRALLIAGFSACGDAPSDATAPSLDASLHAIADESGLAIKDLSVPFDRLMEAPEQLQAVSRSLEHGSSGVYVMRSSDDTLRQTLHVFVINHPHRVYVRPSTAPYEDTMREQHDIHSARFDEEVKTLFLDTSAGVIRLTPLDVTSVGA